jgi:peptide/nickel transport system ATP-binding protein
MSAVQARVLDLLIDLQREFGLAYLFISHDMAVVERIAHRVAVMYAGQIVEIGQAAAVLARPQHSYTRRLIEAVPAIDRRGSTLPCSTRRCLRWCVHWASSRQPRNGARRGKIRAEPEWRKVP